MAHCQYDETLVQETVQNPYQTPEITRIYFLRILQSRYTSDTVLSIYMYTSSLGGQYWMQVSLLTGISRSDLLRFPLSFVSCFLSRYGIFSVWHNLKNFEFFPLGISACGLSWYEIEINSKAENWPRNPNGYKMVVRPVFGVQKNKLKCKTRRQERKIGKMTKHITNHTGHSLQPPQCSTTWPPPANSCLPI